MAEDVRFSHDFRDPDRGQRYTGASPDATGPVTDWATDFSHLDPEWISDPYPIMDDLRQKCPIAHTERFGGAWMPVRYEDVAAVAYDTGRFSSRSVTVSEIRTPRNLAPVGDTPPISSDPPYHHPSRKLLLPAFTKTAIARLEPGTRAYCHELIDSFRAQDVVDAAAAYSNRISTRVICDMLGFPPEAQDEVSGTLRILNPYRDPGLTARDQAMEDRGRMFVYLLAQINDHIKTPREDLTTYLLNAELDGKKLGPNQVIGTMALLLSAGVATTSAAIGASLWHLAGNQQDRERLAAEPQLLPTAMEEFLRAYAPVTMARLVKEDMHWQGLDMKADDWVLLSFPAANRDPDQFERAGEVIIDREFNRHTTFGLGIHRCLGSHLARMELRVALEAWLGRIPHFTLPDPSAVTWSARQARGPASLPLRIH
jgi:cytochrome P450